MRVPNFNESVMVKSNNSLTTSFRSEVELFGLIVSLLCYGFDIQFLMATSHALISQLDWYSIPA